MKHSFDLRVWLLPLVVACGPTQATTSVGESSETVSTGDGSSSGGSTSTSGSSTQTSQGPTSTSSTSSACNFICSDYPVPVDPCDLWAQDCPEGEKCAFADLDGDGAWDGTKCVEVMGSAGYQESCQGEGATGVDDCALGYMCWNMNEEGEGACVGLCGGSPEDPVCAEGQMVFGRTLCLCIPGCDPLAQDCSEGTLCISDLGGEGFNCVLDASGDMSTSGSACEYLNVCDPGNMCANQTFFPHPACGDEAGGCCAPYCDLTQGLEQNPKCAPFEGDIPGVQCVPYYEQGEAPEDYQNVGVCGIPS